MIMFNDVFGKLFSLVMSYKQYPNSRGILGDILNCVANTRKNEN